MTLVIYRLHKKDECMIYFKLCFFTLVSCLQLGTLCFLNMIIELVLGFYTTNKPV